MNSKHEYIVTSSRLNDIVSHCQTKSVVAIDTEFARFKTYYPIVGLIQIYDGQFCYLIDPLQIDDISSLARLMDDRSVTKVFHACSEDLEVLKHSIDAIPDPVFDTQIAAAMLGVGYSISYQSVIEHYLSVRIPKDETRSDWLMRPLTGAQLEYAALDVIHLLEVYEIQGQMLKRDNKTAWVEQECGQLPLGIATQMKPEDYYHRVKNTFHLDRRQLGLLKSLCAWRENKARQIDVPRNRIVEEKSLFLIAQQSLKDKNAFQELAKISPRQLRKYGSDLESVVDESHRVPEHELPPLLERSVSPISSKTLKVLKKIVGIKAEEHSVVPEMLARRRHLEQLLRSVNDQGQYSLPIDLSGWRKEIIGDELLKALSRNEKDIQLELK